MPAFVAGCWSIIQAEFIKLYETGPELNALLLIINNYLSNCSGLQIIILYSASNGYSTYTDQIHKMR